MRLFESVSTLWPHLTKHRLTTYKMDIFPWRSPLFGWHIYGTTSILLIVEYDLGFLQMIIIEAGSHGTSQQPRTCKPDDDVFFFIYPNYRWYIWISFFINQNVRRRPPVRFHHKPLLTWIFLKQFVITVIILIPRQLGSWELHAL